MDEPQGGVGASEIATFLFSLSCGSGVSYDSGGFFGYPGDEQITST
jgi:hypothetical protein